MLWEMLQATHGENWGRTGVNPTPFAWLGGFGVHQLANETFMGDLYLTRHRLYSPRLQRFLSTDPMGLAGGLNLYQYAGGNPVRYVDPLGLCEFKPEWEGKVSNGITLTGKVYTFDDIPINATYHKGDIIKLPNSGYRLVTHDMSVGDVERALKKQALAGDERMINDYYDYSQSNAKIAVVDAFGKSAKIAYAGTGMLNQIGNVDPVGFYNAVGDVIWLNKEMKKEKKKD